MLGRGYEFDMRLIKSSAYRRQPWKNGRGETIEIAVGPADATTANFDWRVSMATVKANDPFSTFEGIDRTLSVLDGQGIELSIDPNDPVTVIDRPYSFPGDQPTYARLLDGPITDLNVMTRRGRFSHRVTPIALVKSKDIVVMSPVALLYCHSGKVEVEEEFVAGFTVSTGETLLIEGMPNGVSMRAFEPAKLYLIEISNAKPT